MIIQIKDIGIIGNASIKLNGITVVAGENSSGKSTVSKTLYSIVHSFRTYREDHIINLTKTVETQLWNIYASLRKNRILHSADKISDIIQNIRYLRLALRSVKTDNLSLLTLTERIIDYLESVNIDDIDIEKIKRVHGQLLLSVQDSELFSLSLQRSLMAEFSASVISVDKTQSYISVSEDNHVSLKANINKNSDRLCIDILEFDELFIDNICYLESPVILDMIHECKNKDSGRVLHLANQLTKPPTVHGLFTLDEVSGNNELSYKITDIIDGNIRYNDEIDHFQLNQNQHVFKIGNVAMGIKSFGMIDILLNNGSINSNSILIIDEPEVHLHPKWQIEYTKIIIEIAKIGCKVIIATHSPYIVQALYMFTKEENITSNFYITERSDKLSYNIDECTDQIHRIFKRLSDPLDELVWRK